MSRRPRQVVGGTIFVRAKMEVVVTCYKLCCMLYVTSQRHSIKFFTGEEYIPLPDSSPVWRKQTSACSILRELRLFPVNIILATPLDKLSISFSFYGCVHYKCFTCFDVGSARAAGCMRDLCIYSTPTLNLITISLYLFVHLL